MTHFVDGEHHWLVDDLQKRLHATVPFASGGMKKSLLPAGVL
jgi:hypothetical protein